MRRINLISVVSIISLALGVGVWIGNNPTQYIRLSPDSLANGSSWRSGVHLIHNGWFVWRDAPYGDLFQGAEVLIPAAIAWIAAIFFVWISSDGRYRTSVAGWLLGGVSATAFLIGRDPIVWSWIAGTMTLAVGLLISKPIISKPRQIENSEGLDTDTSKGVSSFFQRILSKNTIKNILSTALLIMSAGLALQFFPLALIVALILLPPHKHRELTPITGITLIALIIATTTISPSPPILDYPAHTRVVEWEEATEIAPPLIGPSAPIQYVDIRSMQSHIIGPLIVLGSIAAFGSIFGSSRRLAKIVLVGSLLIGWDLIPIRRIHESSILQALSRLLPYHTMYPITWIVAAIIPLILSIVAIQAHRIFFHIAWIFGIGAIAILAGGVPDSSLPSFGKLSIELQLNALLRYKKTTAHSLSDFRAEIAASNNSSDAQQLLYGEINGGRWTSGGGSQQGSEWLALRLEDPQQLVGIVLDSASYVLDFARGIEVFGSLQCNNDWLKAPQNSQLTPLIDINHWLGPIEISQNGLPYYGPLTHMPLYFGEQKELQCLFLRQTGTALNDWSVTSIRLLTRE
jgi:hypothetical protein